MTRSVAMGRHRDDPEADSRPPLEDRIAETRAALARLQERMERAAPGHMCTSITGTGSLPGATCAATRT
jgi:hypothetical protein